MTAPRACHLIVAIAAGLALAGTAHAQSDDAQAPEMNLRGSALSTPDLTAYELDLSAAPAIAEDGVLIAPVTASESAPRASGDNSSASALPWYEQFTAASPADLAAAWGDESSEIRFSAGDRWGFTLGFAEADQGPQFQIEDVSAGAFFAINDRFRLGGQVRFVSPEQDVFGEPGEERAPELKFESAFRF